MFTDPESVRLTILQAPALKQQHKASRANAPTIWALVKIKEAASGKAYTWLIRELLLLEVCCSSSANCTNYLTSQKCRYRYLWVKQSGRTQLPCFPLRLRPGFKKKGKKKNKEHCASPLTELFSYFCLILLPSLNVSCSMTKLTYLKHKTSSRVL